MDFQVAVIGCGALGTHHAQQWHKRDDAKVVAVYDPLAERAEKLAGELGARMCGSYQQAIQTPGVNMVSVCTPAALHLEIACFAAEAGCHVLTEKAIALTLEQADAMIAAAKKNKVKLGVSFQYRGNPKNQLIRKLVQGGEFGGPLFVRFVDCRDVRPKLAMHSRGGNGGPVIDMVGHYFDLMRFYTGCEPVSVYARGHVFGEGKKRIAAVADKAIDAAELMVEYTGGHTLSIFVNWGMPENFAAVAPEIYCGPKLMVHNCGGRLVAQYADHTEAWEDFKPEFQGSSCRMEDMVQAVRNDTEPEVGGPEGRIALAVSLAALKSIESGKVEKVQA